MVKKVTLLLHLRNLFVTKGVTAAVKEEKMSMNKGSNHKKLKTKIGD